MNTHRKPGHEHRQSSTRTRERVNRSTRARDRNNMSRLASVAAIALALAAALDPRATPVKISPTRSKKAGTAQGRPTYAQDFDGTQIFADDLSTMYMHGLTCGACMAVLNAARRCGCCPRARRRPSFITQTAAEGGAMYDLMHAATEPEEFCDGNVLGEKYGLNNLTGHVAAAACVMSGSRHGEFNRPAAAAREQRWASARERR